MGVLSQYRQKGIGGKLLELTAEHAGNKNHIEKIELEVFKSNKAAVDFFLKNGFNIEGERVKSRKLDGQYDNSVLMGKEI
jgi:ribosomal protein S18 acetylase RimI-like enzyme